MRHKRERRWPEDTHMAIGGGITIALIFGAVFAIGYLFPPAPAERQLKASQTVEKRP